MRLVRLKLENYKKIEDCTLNLSQPITALIGRNNSGKSSILNAIFSCIASSGEQGIQLNRNMRDGVSTVELVFCLTKDEWAKLTRVSGVPNPLTTQQCVSFEPCEITKQRQWRYSDQWLINAPQLIGCPEVQKLNTPESNKAMEALNRLATSNLAQVFGAVLLSTAGRRLSQATSFVPYNTLGDPLNQFNSWLFHLKRKTPEKYQEFVYEVRSVFPEIEALDVDYDLDTGNVELKVTERGVSVQGIDMGAGWHSMLALYSYLLSPAFSALILDEPDAHMHAGLVRLLSKFLGHISENVQIILATHNTVFINSLPAYSLWHFEDMVDGRSALRRTESPSDVLSLLRSLGIEVPNEVVPIVKTFERTRAAQTLIEGVDPRLDLKEQILLSSKDHVLSYFPEPDLATLKREFMPNSNAYNLAKELANCPKGKEGWQDYQRVCKKILSFTLCPPLLEPREQSTTEGGEQRRDLVIHIPFGISGFWAWVQRTHDAIAVIADCKNYSESLPSEEITLISKYFGERRLGKFGLILTRVDVGDDVLQEIKRLWTDPGLKIVLVLLTDEDLIAMLKLKEFGGRPEAVIDAHYRKLREQLAR
jgi:energy-coupling factor transporter ATP-binding protein EcfA2